ncbi:MAG: CDP-alcohol phosphatidyltransferase family protein [Candidatus Bathyarchaeota archaeon]
MLSRIKKKIEEKLTKPAKFLLKIGFTPITLTLLNLALSIIATIFYLYASISNPSYHLLLAALFLSLSGFCDMLDGVVARVGNMVTRLGNFLDSIVDRYSDVLILSAITIYCMNNIILLPLFFWGLAAIAGSILTSYVRVKAESLNIRLEGVGLIERPERLLIIILTTIVFHPEIGVVVLALLTNLTVFHRVIYVSKILR